MSNNIDEKVVSLKFQNDKFEENVDKSMSSIEKLKKSLSFKDGKTKGLDKLSRTVNATDFSGLENNVNKIAGRFSNLGIVGVTALQNITNRAIDTGVRLVKSLTVDPVKMGFDEYQLKMNSVRTIMASTGKGVEEVSGYLDELNKYADETIYSFSDMTSNIGKFTNAGVKLDTAVAAIKGVSNVAAVSGANANEASRAMYNFSQALSAGYVKLIDWKSIENANMATKEFKDQLIQSAVATGELVKQGDEYITQKGTAITATKNFNDSLKEGWMTTEVLMNTLNNYSTDVSRMSAEERKAYREKLISLGYTEKQIKAIEKIGTKATDAAREVTTWTKLIDTLQEAVQSGWAKTFEIIFGDIEEAKVLWTGINDVVSTFIGKVDDARNGLLKTWKDAGGRTAIIQGLADLLKYIGSMLKPIAEAFRDVFGRADGNRLADLSKNFANFTASLKLSENTITNIRDTFKGLFSVVKLVVDVFVKLVKAIFPATKTAGSFSRIILSITGAVGRFLSTIIKWINKSKVIQTTFKYLGKVVGALSIALRVLMSAVSLLIDYISTKTDKAFNTIISCFAVLIEYAQKGATWIGSHLFNAIKKYAFPAFSTLQKVVGNSVSKLKEFVSQSNNFNKVKSTFSNGFEHIKTKSVSFADTIKTTLTKFINSNTMATIKSSFSELGSEMKKLGSTILTEASTSISKFINYLKELNILEKIGKYITIAVNKIKELVKTINESFHPLKTLKEWLDPSTLKEYGKSAVQTASSLNVLSKTSKNASGSSGLQKMTDTVKGLIDSLKNNSIYGAITAFKKQILGLDMDKTIERGIGITKIYATVKLLKQSGGITKSISGMFDNVSGLIKGFTNTVNSFGTLATSLSALTTTVQRSLRIQMFKSIAIAIALMAGSLYIISKIPVEKLKTSMITLSIIVGLMIAILTKVNSAQFDPAKMQAAGIAFAALGASLMMVAISAKIFSGMKASALGKAGLALTIFVAEIVAASRLCAKEGLGAATFIGLSVAISLLVPAIILMSKLPFETMAKGGAAIFAFIVLMGLAGRAASKDKVGMASFLGISTAVIALVPVILTLALLPFGKALKAATILSLTMIALGTAVRIASTNFDTKNTFMIVAMGATVGALTASLIALSLVPFGRLAKSVAALGATMLALAATARIMETQKKSIASMALIFGLIAGSVYLLSTIKADVAIKSMAGISILLVSIAGAFKILENVKMSGALLKTAIFALGYMDLVILNVMAVAFGLGKLSQTFKGLKPAMEEGIEVINLVGKFIGALVNGLINGILGNFGNNGLGAQFKSFSKEITEALDNFKGIDSGTVTAAKNVAEALMYITAAEFLNNLNTPLFANDSSMVHFAKQFKLFTDEIAKCDLSSFDEDTVKQFNMVSKMIKAIGKAASEMPAQGGLTGLIAGSKDMGILAGQLFGPNGFITMMNNSIDEGGMTSIDDKLVTQMKQLSTIIKALGSAQDAVPKGFSLSAIIIGMPDMVTLAEQLFGPNGFMKQLSTYLDEVDGNTGLDVKVVAQMKMVASIIGALGEAAGKVGTNFDSESLKAAIIGTTDLPEFAKGIAAIGAELPALITNSEGMNEDAKNRILMVAKVVAALAEAAQIVGKLGNKETGGTGSSVNAGELGNRISSLSGFAEQLTTFIPKFKTFATEAGKISEGDLKAGLTVSKAVKNLAAASKAMKEGGSKVSTKDWENLAKGAKTFAKELSGLDTSKLKENAKALSESIKTVTKTLSGKDTKAGFKSAGKATIQAYIDGLGSTKADSMISKGNAVAKNFITGLNQRKQGSGSAENAGKYTVGHYKKAALAAEGVKKAGNEVGKKFVEGLNSRKKGYGSAWNSGKYTVYQYKQGAKAGKEDYDIKGVGEGVAQGLIDGMNAKKDDAYNAGFELGQQSAKGTKDGAKTNSPSKLTIPIGESIGEGLVVGMNSYANKVYRASSSMGETAALSVNSAFGTNMMGDLGEPTIKPVIDLTNIEKGARQIDGIITNSTGNINPYLLSQDINRQNGVNENMIIANKIDKLASSMNTTEPQQPTNYNFGDVTLEVSSLQDVTTLNQFVDIIKRAKAFN